MSRHFLLFTVCLLFVGNSHAQLNDIEKQPIDSILSWMQNNFTIAADSIDFHGIGRRTITQAQDLDDPRLLAELHANMASWHGYHGFFPIDSTIYHDSMSLKYYIEVNDSVKIAKSYRYLAQDFSNQKKQQKAQRNLFKAIEICEALSDQNGLASCFRTLAEIYLGLKEPQKAVEYADRALEYYTTAEEDYSRAITMHTLIQAHTDLKNYEEAQRYGADCIRLAETMLPDGFGVLIRAYAHKSTASLQEGRLDQALTEATKAWQITKEQVGEESAASFRSDIGNVLLQQKKYAAALPHLLAASADVDGSNVAYVESLIEKISQCYEGLGDYKNALVYNKRLSDARDKINTDKISNLETEAVIKYETGKKDQELAAQATALKQKTRIQWMGTGILTTLLLLLASLLWSYRKNKRTTSALKVKNEENEFLVKEIHHRVKNNLQILSSLLSLQSNYIKDEAAADAIKEGRNRVESMGMIHQRLYTKDQKTAINIDEYINDLCDYLHDSFLLESQDINIKTDIQAGLMDVETAIPLGLVVNELITNSIKYAFPDQNGGEILVKIWINKKDQLCLTVRDDGVGSDISATSKERSTNFGTDLVNVLIKKLKGTLEQTTSGGYATSIAFDRYQMVS